VRMTRLIAVLSTMAILLAACGGTGGGASKADIRIGSDDFYESKLMAEIYSQVLENAGYKVTRNFGLGQRPARAPAFEQGQVDLVPEYVGSGVGFYDITKQTGDGEENRAALQAVMDTKGPDGGKLATVLAITPGQDQNAAVVRPDTASQYNLTKMSDLAAVQDELSWGLPPDCDKNPTCKGALEKYGITYPPKKRTELAACDAPIAEALKGKAVDFAWLCSTQPAILVNGFTRLEDDLKTQPADNVAPLVRQDYLSKVDATAFAALLDAASAKMTTDELLRLGVEVAVNNREVKEVAAEWLTANGLLTSQ
jgi:osmoprotectant transport system substrate-binding protein